MKDVYTKRERWGEKERGLEEDKLAKAETEVRDKKMDNIHVSSMHTCEGAQMCSRSELVTFL